MVKPKSKSSESPVLVRTPEFKALMPPTLPPPPPLQTAGSLHTNWMRFKQAFEFWMKGAGHERHDDDVKIAILLSVVGPDGLEIFNILPLTAADKEDFDEVMEAFDTYCGQKKNVIFERFVFTHRQQREGEKFDDFLRDITTLVQTCEYGNLRDSLLRDQIVFGLHDRAFSDKLMGREARELTLEKVVEACKIEEQRREQMKVMSHSDPGPAGRVDQINKKGGATGKRMGKTSSEGQNRPKANSSHKTTNQNTNNNTKKIAKSNNRSIVSNCSYCGYDHAKGKCPAFGKTCSVCGRQNHFSTVCRNRSQTKNAGELSVCYMDVLESDTGSPWCEVIRIDNMDVSCKLDTGADVNVLPARVLSKIGVTELEDISIVLQGFGTSSKIKPLGKKTLKVVSRGVLHDLDFVIVDLDVNPILGLKSCVDLGLINRVFDVRSHSNAQEFVDKYSDVFTGIGCFKQQHRLKVDPRASPTAKPPRRVAFALLDKLKKELGRLCEDQIISPVNEPTEWISNLTIVEKPDKSLRLCLDPRDLNKVLLKEPYLIPTIDDLRNKLANKKIFSVLDLKDGFFQIKLDKRSSFMCSFNTPFGVYRYNRLPFGLSISPEVFQKFNEENFADIDGVFVYIDDLLIFADSIEEHDRIMERVMKRARERNIKFNPRKLQYRVEKVSYLGHEISRNGFRPDQGRLDDLQEIKAPSTKVELQKILGMINYIRTFIPNLAELSKPLRDLLKKDSIFSWTKAQEDCLERIKKLIKNSPHLSAFDDKNPIKLQCDASQFGLGACLLQNGKPVAFYSRSLNDAEQRYAQIEKEMLSIVFACKKFHNYVYGRQFLVETDHKPLVAIMEKPLCGIPSARLQRLRIKLLPYNLTLHYLPGKYMYIADVLSRFFKRSIGPDDAEEDLTGYVHTINISDSRKQQFVVATKNDPILSKLLEIYHKGWPNDKRGLHENMRFLWKLKDDLHVENDIVFMNDKIFVPVSLRRTVLDWLHVGHFGVEKSKARARELFFWPGLATDVEDKVGGCKICIKFSKQNVKEPLINHEIPELPFVKLGMDILDFEGKPFLIVVDYYSKWLEIIKLTNKTTAIIIDKLIDLFATHGHPRMIIADNMPFGSKEFRNFAREFEFDLTTSSPHYPKSNGLAEKYVNISKNILRKSKESGSDFRKALLEYRNTPLKDLKTSPAELLMSRKCNTYLPVSNTLLVPKVNNTVRELQDRHFTKQKQYYDRNCKGRDDLAVGDKVVYLDKNGKWLEAIVTSLADTPRSYWIRNSEGSVYRRNKHHLKKLTHQKSHNPDLESGRTIIDHNPLSNDKQSSSKAKTNFDSSHSGSSRELRRSERLKSKHQ